MIPSFLHASLKNFKNLIYLFLEGNTYSSSVNYTFILKFLLAPKFSFITNFYTKYLHCAFSMPGGVLNIIEKLSHWCSY